MTPLHYGSVWLITYRTGEPLLIAPVQGPEFKEGTRDSYPCAPLGN